MIRLLVGALLSAVVLFFWGFVFWAASGVMYRFMFPLPNEDEVTQALQNAKIESGTYLIPFPAPEAMSGADPKREADFMARHVRGPVVEIVYRKEGLDPRNVQEYVVGFCHYLAASLLAGVLLVMAQPGLQRYPARVLFVALVGVFACVAIAFAKPVWFHHPWPAILYESAYNAIGWLLAGLVMALVIRPVKEAAPPSAPPSAALRETGTGVEGLIAARVSAPAPAPPKQEGGEGEPPPGVSPPAGPPSP